MAEEYGTGEPDAGPWPFVNRCADGSLVVRPSAAEQAKTTTDDDLMRRQRVSLAGCRPVHERVALHGIALRVVHAAVSNPSV